MAENIRFIIRGDDVININGSVTHDLADFIERRLENAFGANTSCKISRLTVAESEAESPIEYQDGSHTPRVEIMLSTRSPLIDCELLRIMIDRAFELRADVACEGAVPGSAPLSVVYVGDGKTAQTHFVIHDTQHRYNSQLSVNRAKRLKVFQSLVLWCPKLHAMPTRLILDFLGTDEGVKLILSYGENVELERYDKCPNCNSAYTYAVRCGSGQPVLGFLTRDSAYYYFCGDCGLVYLSPVMRPADISRLYDWYDREGIDPATNESFLDETLEGTSYFQNFDFCLRTHGPTLPSQASILDLGGGTGQFAVIAKRRFPNWSVNVVDFDCEDTIELLDNEGIVARSANLTHIELGVASFDMITMWEVLEHLRVEDLKAIWKRIYLALKPGGLFVFSTPDFASPYARAAEFWAAFAPQHVTVLSRRVLEPMWSDTGFELLRIDAESLTFRRDRGYFAYGTENHDSLSSRAEAALIEDVLRDEEAHASHVRWMRETGRGAEMIVSLRR